MTDLTPRVVSLIERLFPDDQHDKVRKLMEKSFTAELLHLIGNDEAKHGEGIERIQSAVLELSEGQLDRLRSEIRVAHTDWRDVLYGLWLKHERERKK